MAKKIFSNSQYLGFFAYVRNADGDWKLRVNWLRFALVGIAFVAIVYFGFTTKRYYNDKYNVGLESTKYTTIMAFPFSREIRNEHRKALGDLMIQKALESKDPMSIITGVRNGLQLSQYNPEGRIYYSYIMFYQRMFHDACEFLAGGLKYALEHLEYTNYFVRRALACVEDEILLATIDECLPICEELLAGTQKEFEEIAAKIKASGVPADAPENAELLAKLQEIKKRHDILASNRLVMQASAVQSLILRGYFDIARQRMNEYNIKNTATGQVLFAQILWETNKKDEAIEFLNAVCQQTKNNLQVVMLRAMYLVQMDKKLQARSGLMPILLSTDDPEIRLRIITLFDTPETQSFWETLTNDFLERYTRGGNVNSRALLLLAQYATDNDKFDLAERVYKISEKNLFEETANFEMLHIESLIARGESRKALDVITALTEQNLAWVERNSGIIECLRTIAFFKLGNETAGQLALENAIKNRGVPVAQLISLGRRLTDMNYIEQGHMAFQAAYMSENYNQQALLALVNYALDKQDSDALFKYLPELLATRRPTRSILERIRNYLASDRLLFSLQTDIFLERVETLLESNQIKLGEEPVAAK